jgi:hypothetical protein
MFVVSRNEDDHRCLARVGDGAQCLKAVAAWHLNVEEQQVRLEISNGGDRRRARCRFANDLDSRMFS